VDIDCFDHFQELRFKIDEHREQLKETIDKIALNMIEEIKKFQVVYLTSIAERLENAPKSIDDEMNELNELFRDPDLLLVKIKQRQQKK
jgi:hypothetical protein